MKKVFFLLLIALFVLSVDAFAGKRYWVSASTKNWTTSNWSTSSGGLSGATVPGNTDTAYFDGGGAGGCGLSTTISVMRIEVASGYSGTLTASSNTFTIGAGGGVFGGGTFTGNTGAIVCDGALTISGTAFTSSSNTLTCAGNFTLSSGSFTANGGTVVFTTSNTIAGTISFNNLTFTPAATAVHDISNTITVNGTLTLGGSNTLTLNTGTIDTKSTITITNSATGGGGSATVTITGTASPTLTGSGTIGQGALPKVQINKSSGTLTLSNIISSANDWTWTAGALTTTGSTVAFLNSCTITGSHTLNNVTFQSNSSTTYGIANTLTVNGTLTTAGSGALTFNTGTIDAKAAVTLNNTGTGGGGSALITLTGTNNPTITGGSTVGHSALPRVTINKTGGLAPGVTLSGIISVANTWTYTSGTITYGTSTVAFLNTLTISGTHGLYNVTFTSGGSATYTISNTLTVNGTLTTDGAGTLTYNTGTIDTKSTINLNNSGTGGGGSATVSLTGTNSLTMTGNSTVGQSALPKVTINKGGGTLTLASTISVANDWTWTAGTLSTSGSTVAFMGSMTIAGSHTLDNVTFQSNSASTYAISNTLTVNATLTTGGSGALTFNTGTIDTKGNINLSNSGTGGGGSATITATGTGTVTLTGNSTAGQSALPKFTINKTGGSLSMASTISAANDWTWTAGTVSAGSSTVAFVKTLAIAGTHTLANLVFQSNSPATYTLGSSTILTGSTMTTGGTGALTFNTSVAGSIYVNGDLTLSNSGTGGGGSAFIYLKTSSTSALTGNSTIGQSALPHFIIDKSSGTVSLSGVITSAGDWSWVAGTVSPGSSEVAFIATCLIKGSHSLNKVTFTASGSTTYTIHSTTTLTVTGLLLIAGSGALTFTTGVIEATNNVTVTNSAAGGGGSTTFNFAGASAQQLTGSGTAAIGVLPRVRIDKSGNTLSLVNIISCGSNWTYVTGTVSAGTSTVAFCGSLNLDGQGTSSTMAFNNVIIHTPTVTLTGILDVDKDFTINTSSVLDAAGFKMYVGGNWANAGTFTANSNTVEFDGVKYNTLTRSAGTETFYNLIFNRDYDAGVKKSVTLGSRVDVTNVLTMTKGRVKTTSSFYLRLIDNATCTGGSNVAYVHGPMRKLGNDAFTFPLGDTIWADTASWHPLSITAPSSVSDEYSAEYKGTAQTQGAGTVDSLFDLSTVEHWNLNRTAGSSAVTVTLGWNKNDLPSSLSDLRVAAWNNSTSWWADLGQASLTVSWPLGTITAALTTIFNSNAAVLTTAYAFRGSWKGYATLHRKLDGGYYEAIGNALYFRFDDEYNDQNHNLTYSIYNAANTDVAPTLVASANNAALSYYGDNRFKLDLWTTSSPLSAGYYILEVRNEKNEIFYLRFKKS